MFDFTDGLSHRTICGNGLDKCMLFYNVLHEPALVCSDVIVSVNSGWLDKMFYTYNNKDEFVCNVCGLLLQIESRTKQKTYVWFSAEVCLGVQINVFQPTNQSIKK